MTNNPLALRRQTEAPTFDPIERLQRHCETLNSMAWVRNSGRLYFVNKRDRGPEVQHYIDRKD